jgi:hypothetical protein
MAKSKTSVAEELEPIEIDSINTMEIEVCVLGTSPLLLNRLNEKARHELLMPSPKKNAAEKAMHLKHRPYEEYRASVFRTRDETSPTRLVFPGGGFRRAMGTAALDLPGSSKAQIGRLVRLVEWNVCIYGVPHINCMIVRQAGIQKTPDVRTRAILPHWACRFSVRFAHPLLKEKSVMSLLAAAGDFVGVGDGRVEKGSSLMCGCFKIVQPDDAKFLDVLAKGSMSAQDEALANPKAFDLSGDDETAELLAWFDEELVRRDHAPPAATKAKKTKEKLFGNNNLVEA